MKKLSLLLIITLLCCTWGVAFATDNRMLNSSSVLGQEEILKATPQRDVIAVSGQAQEQNQTSVLPYNPAFQTETSISLSNKAPEKVRVDNGIPGVPDPNVILQGGDNIATATVIGSIPYSNTGTTDGYTNDYNEICPYSSLGGLDVVYSYVATSDMLINVTLCGNSAYDTKVYVYENSVGNVVGCNDDACYTPSYTIGPYVSNIPSVSLHTGNTYYIIVDGYSEFDFGDYTIDIIEVPVLDCDITPFGTDEGEEDCYDEYVDVTNGGCNSAPPVFGAITVGEDFTGTSGTYLYIGSQYRDTDWIQFNLGVPSIVTFTVECEFPVMLAIMDLGEVDPCAFTYSYTMGDSCTPVTLSLALPAGACAVFVAPSVFAGIPCGSEYNLSFDSAIPFETPPNDNCADVTPEPLLPGVQLTFTGDNTGATADCPLGGYPEVWHAITTDVCMDITLDYCGTDPAWFNVYIIMNTGCPCDANIYANSWSQSCPDGNFSLLFRGVPPGTYYVPVLNDPANGAVGPYTLNLNGVECPPPPPNDNCVDVTPQLLLPGVPLQFVGNSNGATVDCTLLGAPEAWEAFEVTECQDVIVDYCGSETIFNTVYIVMVPDCPCSGYFFATTYNFADCGDGNPTLYFLGLQPGIYYIPVYAGGVTGPYTINVNGATCAPPPENDLCDDAILVTVPSSTIGTTMGSTIDDAPFCGTNISSGGVWYEVLGTGNTITATVCAEYTNYDTKMSVYCPDCATLACVTGNDDNCALPNHGLNSTVTWCSEVGESYLILVHGYGSGMGDFQLDVSDDGTPCTGAPSCEPPPPPPSCDAGDLFGQSPTDINGAWNFLTSDANSDPAYLVQDNFSGVVAADIAGIKFWGLDLFWTPGWSECNEDPVDFTVTFYEDDGGLPGAITCTYTVTPTRTFSAQYAGFYEMWEYIATFDTPCTMIDGWISIQGLSVGGDVGDCWFLWCNSPEGDLVSYQNGGPLGTDLAFCLQGGGVPECDVVAGDANGSGICNGLDVGYMVNYLKGGPLAPPDQCDCPATIYAAADANASCTFNGLDVTYLVNYLKGGTLAPAICPTCP